MLMSCTPSTVRHPTPKVVWYMGVEKVAGVAAHQQQVALSSSNPERQQHGETASVDSSRRTDTSTIFSASTRGATPCRSPSCARRPLRFVVMRRPLLERTCRPASPPAASWPRHCSSTRRRFRSGVARFALINDVRAVRALLARVNARLLATLCRIDFVRCREVPEQQCSLCVSLH